MGFLGVWQGSSCARIAIEARAKYLYASALRLSLDHRVLLCYDGEENEEPPPHLFCAIAKAGRAFDADMAVRLYRRYGRRFMKHLPSCRGVALYDSRAGKLYLHGGGGGIFWEKTEDGVLFSSERWLLRQPVCVDFAILK